MASCDTCGTTIVFGGVKTDGFHFCGAKCAQRAPLLQSAKAVDGARVDTAVNEILNGTCPICGGPGPVDMRFSYQITSMFVISMWNTKTQISCAKCGKKKQMAGLVHCALLGWWGFPNGLLRTPFMIGANIKAMSAGKKTEPSDALKKHVRLKLAAESPPPMGVTPYSRQPGSV